MSYYRLFAIPALFLLLTSCKGQQEATDTKVKSIPLGKIVTSLSPSIWTVFQDSKGNYWFGSNKEGLFCFDGKSLIQFTVKDGLVANSIRGIQENDLGNIFISTFSGVSRYDGKQFSTLVPVSSPANQWKLTPKDLWFNCDGILYRYDGNTLYKLSLPQQDLAKAFGNREQGLNFEEGNNSPYSIFGIDRDKEGNVWFGTATAGAFRYDGKEMLWIGEQELTTLDDGRVPGVRSMIQDKEGYFWLSNMRHKYRMKADSYQKLAGIDLSKHQVDISLSYFMSAVLDKEGNLWMLSYSEGLWKYDGKQLTQQYVKNGSENVLLITMYKDLQGDLWLGTFQDGVYTYNGDTFQKFEPWAN